MVDQFGFFAEYSCIVCGKLILRVSSSKRMLCFTCGNKELIDRQRKYKRGLVW